MDIVQQAVELGVKRVQPHLYGESHLHPDYVRILSEIKRRWPEIILSDTTNGSALTKPGIAGAMYEYLDKLTISLDGGCATTIEDIRPGLNGADILAAIIDYLGRPDCGQDIIVNTVIMDRNRDEIAGIGLLLESSKRTHGWAHADMSDLHGYNETDKPLRDMSRACTRPFNVITVDVNGDVILCCRDQHSEWTAGNALDGGEHPLKDAWEYMDGVRAQHGDGNSGSMFLCSRCTYCGYRGVK